MPYHQSAKKRLRRDTKRNLMNKSRLSALRTVLKKARTHLDRPDHIIAAQKTLAIAAAHGLIHPNAAARKTSRLMKKVSKSQEAAVNAQYSIKQKHVQ